VETNALYHGDNLDILRRYVPDESVDLVYLDPPFSSNRDYNVIFRDESGRDSDAQLLAFEDTWHWGPGVESLYSYLTNTSACTGGASRRRPRRSSVRSGRVSGRTR
jgi:site-specific DNA-methyltransferase (adenine-specific)